jgi:hypothetical protein
LIDRFCSNIWTEKVIRGYRKREREKERKREREKERKREREKERKREREKERKREREKERERGICVCDWMCVMMCDGKMRNNSLYFLCLNHNKTWTDFVERSRVSDRKMGRVG